MAQRSNARFALPTTSKGWYRRIKQRILYKNLITSLEEVVGHADLDPSYLIPLDLYSWSVSSNGRPLPGWAMRC
jgi:hypothetical protein